MIGISSSVMELASLSGELAQTSESGIRMMEQNFINYSCEDRIAILELDDPSANTLTYDLIRELEERLLQVALSEPLVGIIIIGKGEKFFSGGVNIGMLLTAGRQHNSHFILHAVEVLELIKSLKVPVVTIINGNITGGGLELALIADYRIAVEGNYNIGFPEVRLGVIPGMGGTQRLSRLVGAQMALELITQGDFISPERALAIGLVDEVLAKENFRATAIQQAKKFISSHDNRLFAHTLPLSNYQRLLERDFIKLDIADGIATLSINQGVEDFHWTDLMLALNHCLLDVRVDEDIYGLLIKLNAGSFGIPSQQDQSNHFLFHYATRKLINFPRIVALTANRPLDELEFELALCCDYRFVPERLARCADYQPINTTSPEIDRFRNLVCVTKPQVPIANLVASGFFKANDAPEQWLRKFVPPQGAGQAIGYAKLAITQGRYESLTAGLFLERHLQEQLFIAPDSKEGMQAYLEKRKPFFVGTQWSSGQQHTQTGMPIKATLTDTL